MTKAQTEDILKRIHSALEAAREVLSRYTAGAIDTDYKVGHDPVTEADREVDRVLHKELLREGEGWLSEETVDDLTRLDQSLVWVVDPLDGTREFVKGIPEFCVSVALVENGTPVAGGICNPATNERFLGALGFGITYNGKPAQPSQRTTLNGATVLASRSEVKRGEWEPFKSAGFNTVSMGSVAYKLARVSAGLDDVTFTLTPKNEWDVAAGAALVASAGGFVRTLDGTELKCNQKNPLLPGMFACGPHMAQELTALIREHRPVVAARE
jgi:myo-inositol-1(or 4)-monophosphatase